MLKRRQPYPLGKPAIAKPKRRIMPLLTRLGGYGFILVVLSSLLGEWFWPGDLLTNFTLQILLGGLLLTLILLVMRQWVTGGIVLVFSLYLLVPLSQVWNFTLQDMDIRIPQKSDTLTVVQHNIGHFNEDRAALVNSLISESENADVIILFEVAPRWTWFLRPLDLLYPNKLIAPQLRSFGFAVYTRSKDITIEKDVLYSGYPIGIIRGKTKKDKTPFVIYAIHTPSPTNLIRWTDRNTMLQEVARRIRDDQTPNKIVIGDLNITPYSPWFSTLKDDAKLELPKQNLQQLGTWPAWMPSNWLRIPLDHRLASSGITQESTPLSGYGSDHVMVRSTYYIPALH